MSRRPRILLSAYACEPGTGSEPGIGWHTAEELAEAFEVWVVTRANNRPEIQRRLRETPRPNLHFVYVDVPPWLRWWKRGRRGMQVYYYLWQLWINRSMRRLHTEVGFDTAQHITFGRYWTPSRLADLGVPFVWGPVGGGDSVPPPLRPALPWRGRLLDRVRSAARWLGERDPLVRATARGSSVALAATPATAARLRALGALDVRLLPAAALPPADVEPLAATSPPRQGRKRFVSIGHLLYWKGFELGLRAFAAAGLPDSELIIVGDGPQKGRLERLATELGVADRVLFRGSLPRQDTLAVLSDCDALIHPSLHDSGGWVCLEAMAAGRPVVCLDLGGPSVLVDPAAGVRVPVGSADAVLTALADAMRRLAEDPELGRRMGEAGRRHVDRRHTWTARGAQLRSVHTELLEAGASRTGPRWGTAARG